MNINKILPISFCFLFLFVTVTILNLNYSRKRGYGYEVTDNEILSTNISCIPEIIRSYERIKHIYGKNNTLFFRYVNNTCSSCIDSQLTEILTLQEEIGKDYIWIFPAYPDDRNSKIQLSNELAKYNYMNIPASLLLIPIVNDEPQSYFAYMNGEGEISMVFVPDRDKVQYTRQYLLEVKKLLVKVN